MLFAFPCSRSRPIEWQAPGASGFDALLMTSANALRFGGEQLAELSRVAGSCRRQGNRRGSARGRLRHRQQRRRWSRTAAWVAGSRSQASSPVRRGSLGDPRRPAGSDCSDGLSIEDDRTGTGCPRGSGLDRDAPLAACRHGASLLSRKSSSSIGVGSAILAISNAAAQAAGPGWERVEMRRTAQRRSPSGPCEAAVRQAAAGMNATSYRRRNGLGRPAGDRHRLAARRRRCGDLGPRPLPRRRTLSRRDASRAAAATDCRAPTAFSMQRRPVPSKPRTNKGSPTLEQRLARVESATQQAQGSAGRADALVVAFAARRAIDRGLSLGYLEPLLAIRFGPQHQQAVATVITAAHQPVRLNDLITRI